MGARPELVGDDPQVGTLDRDGVRARDLDPLAPAARVLRLAVYDLTKVEPTVQDGANARCGPVSLRRCGLAVPRLAGRVDDALAVQLVADLQQPLALRRHREDPRDDRGLLGIDNPLALLRLANVHVAENT